MPRTYTSLITALGHQAQSSDDLNLEPITLKGHSIKLFKYDEINENLDLLRPGKIVGRAVMKF